MRTIKFKVFNRTQSKMSESFTLEDLLRVEVPLLSRSVMTDDIEWLQYVGLKDKNGTEIYDDDLIRWKDGEVVQVFWQEIGARSIGYSTDYRYGEVIGNIHENPELLEAKQ